MPTIPKDSKKNETSFDRNYNRDIVHSRIYGIIRQ
jgi:hypothetical protein